MGQQREGLLIPLQFKHSCAYLITAGDLERCAHWENEASQTRRRKGRGRRERGGEGRGRDERGREKTLKSQVY